MKDNSEITPAFSTCITNIIPDLQPSINNVFLLETNRNSNCISQIIHIYSKHPSILPILEYNKNAEAAIKFGFEG